MTEESNNNSVWRKVSRWLIWVILAGIIIFLLIWGIPKINVSQKPSDTTANAEESEILTLLATVVANQENTNSRLEKLEAEPEVEEPEPVEEPEEPEPVVELDAIQPELILAECPLEDKGLRLEFEGPNEGEFYLISGLSQDLEPYQGCNFLFEGRQFLTKEHHIWVFQGPNWQLQVREGSLWVYPEEWNMADFSAAKPPIASEFVTAKRHNQIDNDYNWVIYVHDGENNYVFPAGEETPQVILPDNAQFSEPEPLAVQGVWDGNLFNASIGAENTVTVALLDGKLFYWQDAVDSISYETVQAWIMPSGWSIEQIEGWAVKNFPNQKLAEYIG